MGNMEELGLNVEEEAKGMTDFTALPEGDYVVVITDAELKDNKNGGGQHIGVTMQVIEGEMEGRMTWANFNIKNANATAEKIGRAELAALCLALGLQSPKDTDELKDKPFGVTLGIDKKDPTKNRVKAYFASESVVTSTTKPVLPPKQAATPPPAAVGRKPWQKK